MKSAIMQLETLTCPSCVIKVEKMAKSLNGIDKDSVEVLFNSSKLKFDFDEEKISVDDVEKAISAMGFDILKIQVKEK